MVSLPVWVSCFKKCKESNFFCKHQVPRFLNQHPNCVSHPLPVHELLCSCLDCRKNDFVHIFSLKFQRHQGFVCTTCFAVAFWNLFSFSLDGFSEAASEAEHGPPTHALLGLPPCCIAREMGSAAFCYLCCMENGSFSVSDNLNNPCLISFFTAVVILQPVPNEINHYVVICYQWGVPPVRAASRW